MYYACYDKSVKLGVDKTIKSNKLTFMNSDEQK